MILFIPFITPSKKNNNKTFYRIYFLFILILLLIQACSTTTRFNDEYEYSRLLRVLLSENLDSLDILTGDKIFIGDSRRAIIEIGSGKILKFKTSSNRISLLFDDKEIVSDTIVIIPGTENGVINLSDKKYRGRLKFFSKSGKILMLNQITLEDYVKGVICKEMPVGKGNENYEALKAFSICIRAYAVNKLKENKDTFDIYPDTRDQVYGGVDAETDYSNQIVDETRNFILYFNDNPAIIFYHSTCGGYTESSKNVFTKEDISYLRSVKDGSDTYCKISPKSNWMESYSESLFVSRLVSAGLIDDDAYSITDIKIISRFESGRVNEMIITLNKKNNSSKKNITLKGNKIRSIIRTGDDKSILYSTMFDVKIDSKKNIIITGKGYGHGVGLCQWGAIGQARAGKNFEQILNHYYPGTTIKQYYDQF